MINSLYTTLLTFGLVLSSPFFALKILTTSRYRRGLSQRLGFRYKPISEKVGDEKPIWIHAASVGEVLGSLPIINGIKGARPELPILLSTMTATGNEVAEKRASGVHATTFFPLDHPWAVGRAISLVNPRAFLMAETEIWPNFLMELGRREIPVLLFNGRISTRSLQWYKRFRFFIASPLTAISAFCMQSSLDAQRIIEIGANPKRVTVTGNIKFDQPPPEITRREREALLQTLGLHAGQPVLIAGSTHRGEEEFMLKVLRLLSPEYPDLVLLLAPNSIGTLIFVGGSLVKVGGHNILEPLFFKKPVLFGPFMDNFREISHEVLSRGAGFQISGEEEMVLHAKTFLENPSLRSRMGECGFEIISDNRGATKKTLETILRFV